MTTMRRVTISLPQSIDKKILEVKKDDKFIRCSYAEIVRKALDIGLSSALLINSCSDTSSGQSTSSA